MRIVAALAAALGLTLAAGTAPAQAGVFGTLQNDTQWGFYAAKYATGSDTCPTWNKDGNNTPNNYNWTCSRTNVSPHTTTGTWYDVDGFTVPYLSDVYTVCFITGPCRNIPSGTYTRLKDYQRAVCSQGSDGHIYCTVS
jgi:hypothetical protein